MELRRRALHFVRVSGQFFFDTKGEERGGGHLFRRGVGLGGGGGGLGDRMVMVGWGFVVRFFFSNQFFD